MSWVSHGSGKPLLIPDYSMLAHVLLVLDYSQAHACIDPSGTSFLNKKSVHFTV